MPAETILMNNIRLILIPTLLVITSFHAYSQPVSYSFKIAQDRMLWHDNIDKEQKRLLALDGRDHDTISFSKDETVNLEIADALIRQVDELQKQIERDSTLSGQAKIKYLRSLESMVKGYDDNCRKKDFPPSLAPGLVLGFAKAMLLDKNNKSIEPVIAENSYGIGKILVECFLRPSENIGVRPSRILLERKFCELHPEEIFTILVAHQDLPFKDSLIMVTGQPKIRQLYDYAVAHSSLAIHIRNSKDSLISTVARMANSKS